MASALWIVGSEVATTCTSRIAMNMPTHIMAKPIDTDRVAGFCKAGLSAADISRSDQRRILRADAQRQNARIGDRENQRKPGQAEAERQCGDLSDYDDIVRMRQKTIGAVGRERRARQNDDARRPAPTERRQSPEPQDLQGEKDRQPDRIERPLPTENPQTRQPERMQQDDRRIMGRCKFAGPLRKQGRGVAVRPIKLGQTFRRDGAQQNYGRNHAALFSETQLAVKPGPIAVSKVREGRPASISRSSTKSAVGADMLP